MCKPDEIIEPLGMPEFFVEDAAAVIRDGIIFVTYCRKHGGETIGVVRLIASLERMPYCRAAVTTAVKADASPHALRVVAS